MKKIHIIFLLSAIITPNITFGADDQCQGKTETACKDANCQWKADENVENGGICEPCGSGTVGINGECKQCEANQYIKDGKCKACPDPYKNSDPGSDEITDCYQQCETDETVDNGKIVFQDSKGQSVSRIYWSTDEKQCSDYKKIICDNNPNNICQSYHLENNACKPNWKTETKDTSIKNCETYLTLYKNNNWSETKYCIACKDNYHPEATYPIEEQCTLKNQTSPVTEIKSCEANEQACSNLETRDTDYSGQGRENCNQPTGTYKWNSNENKYDYQNCKMECTQKLGWTEKTYTYTYDSKNDRWVRGEQSGPTTCTKGCIAPDEEGADCGDAKKGYYAAPGELMCQKCPGGTTTTTDGTTTTTDGATSIDACKVSKDTQFCNSSGSCFTLPIDDDVYLNPPAAIFGTSN